MTLLFYNTYYRHFRYYRNDNKANSWNDIVELAGVYPLNMKELLSAWQYLVEKSAQILEGNCLFQYCGFEDNFKTDIYIPSKNKIIDAATSDYKDKHKLNQYNKSMKYVQTVEYWCLNKKPVPGLNLPNLKYVFAYEISERLDLVVEYKLSNNIKNLYAIYENFTDTYTTHRREYIITKLK